MTLLLRQVLEDPTLTRRILQEELFGVVVDRVLVPRCGGVILDMSFTPFPELAAARYRAERARVSIRPDGCIYAFPLGPERTWFHRDPSPLGQRFGYLAGPLCLWYPNDPRSLRWEWDDGLEQYVTRLYRHVFYEEYCRREGRWPVEDTPHGDPLIGGVYPIRSARMRREERRWAS